MLNWLIDLHVHGTKHMNAADMTVFWELSLWFEVYNEVKHFVFKGKILARRIVSLH